jgi:hypothetical protein
MAPGDHTGTEFLFARDNAMEFLRKHDAAGYNLVKKRMRDIREALRIARYSYAEVQKNHNKRSREIDKVIKEIDQLTLGLGPGEEE